MEYYWLFIFLAVGLYGGYQWALIKTYFSKRKVYWEGQKYGYKVGVQHSKCVEARFAEQEDKITAECFVPTVMDRRYID